MHYIAVGCPGPELCTLDICTCKSEILKGARKLIAIAPRYDMVRNVLMHHDILPNGRPPWQDCRVEIATDREKLYRVTRGQRFDIESDALLYLGLPHDLRNHNEFFRMLAPTGFPLTLTYGWTVPTRPGEWKNR